VDVEAMLHLRQVSSWSFYFGRLQG
jgi:hypothetical protein